MRSIASTTMTLVNSESTQNTNNDHISTYKLELQMVYCTLQSSDLIQTFTIGDSKDVGGTTASETW
jgi:hypothetical protein